MQLFHEFGKAWDLIFNSLIRVEFDKSFDLLFSSSFIQSAKFSAVNCKSKEEFKKAFEDQKTLTNEFWESRGAKEEASNIPRRVPTPEQHKEYDRKREEEIRRKERENEAKRR